LALPLSELSADRDQGTRCYGEDGHHDAQSREAEIEQRNEPGQDEPYGQQQQPDTSFHWRTPLADVDEWGPSVSGKKQDLAALIPAGSDRAGRIRQDPLRGENAVQPGARSAGLSKNRCE